MLNCPNCKRQLHKDSNYCPYCMEKLSGTITLGMRRNNILTKIRYIVPVFVVLLIAGLVVIVTCISGRKKGNENGDIETTPTVVGNNFLKPTEATNNNATNAPTTSAQTQATSEIVTEESVTEAPTTPEVLIKDEVEWWKYSRFDRVLEFDSRFGPLFKIDVRNGEVLECTAGEYELYECILKDGYITVKVSSNEISIAEPYVFDLSSIDNIDKVPFCNVYADGVVEISLEHAGFFRIDYISKEMLMCTDSEAVLSECIRNGDELLVKIRLSETCEETYKIDLKENTGKFYYSMGAVPEYDGVDFLTKVYQEGEFIEMYSLYGSWYRIYVGDGLVFNEYTPVANSKKYIKYGNIYYVTFWDDIVLREMSYFVNLDECVQLAGIEDYQSSDMYLEGVKAANSQYGSLLAGKEIDIVGNVATLNIDEVPTELKSQLDSAISARGYKLAEYIDINMLVFGNETYVGEISKVEKDVELMISLITPATREDVDYYLIGIKDGKAEVIETTGMDYGCIRFITDFFTTYALVYK